MQFWDISLVSFTLGLVVMVTAFVVYRKKGSQSALFISIGYIFFLAARLAYLKHISEAHHIFIFLRIIGYCFNLYAILLLRKRS